MSTSVQKATQRVVEYLLSLPPGTDIKTVFIPGEMGKRGIQTSGTSVRKGLAVCVERGAISRKNLHTYTRLALKPAVDPGAELRAMASKSTALYIVRMLEALCQNLGISVPKDPA